MTAFVFPGQGSQFKGMANDLCNHEKAIELLEIADSVVGFSLSEIMKHGTDEDLKRTDVTQPAVFVHSVITYLLLDKPKPAMVAGHSLGEFSALVASDCLSFENALRLVAIRAQSMQKACEQNPGTMAAVLGYSTDEMIEEVCASITDDVVVPANYNAPGQLVISGTISGIDKAIVKLKAAGVKRVLKLPVGGAFHSPLMQPAAAVLENAIHALQFNVPLCPIYQNVTAKAELDAASIKLNLIKQLTAPVRWTQSVKQMLTDGATEFMETGPSNVLTGLIGKIRV